MLAGEALPGIRVEPAAPPQAGRLPRMDVAVFAGFAERGPCHVPVPVASAAAYRSVFGGDLALAWDAEAGTALSANLPAAVRAFFSNGGERCWVIRCAATGPLIAAIAAEGGDTAGLVPAARAVFEVGGVLSSLPAGAGAEGPVGPARLAAASLGAWPDSLRLAARVERQPIPVGDLAPIPFGLRFDTTGALRPGDLVEFTQTGGSITHFGKVVAASAGTVSALWIAGFERAADASKVGAVAVGGDGAALVGELREGETCALTGAAGALSPAPGSWLKLDALGETIWLRADVSDGLQVRGPAWRPVEFSMPAAPRAAKVTIGLRDVGGGRTFAGLSPAPEGAEAVQGIVDDDLFHGREAARGGAIRPPFAVTHEETARIAEGYSGAGDAADLAAVAARMGTAAFGQAERTALAAAWLPIGLDGTFGDAAAAEPSAADPLERNGLAVADARLFLDPRLESLSADLLVERAAAIRHIEEKPLFGIHAALGIEGDLFPEPSLAAVPDAVQPGWMLTPEGDEGGAPAPQPGASAPANWRTHSGGCPPEDPVEPLTGPDRSRFLDSTTEVLAAPTLGAPDSVPPGEAILLHWNAQPAGSLVVLEESERPDFAAATEILRSGDATAFTAGNRAEGLHYFRLRVEHDGNVSSYASAVVTVRGSRYRVQPADPARLRRLHVGLLRLAGGSRNFFAVLSLPRALRSGEAIEQANALRILAPGGGSAERLSHQEERLLSYGALYHPWLGGRGGRSSPPDGAVAGMMAERARTRGAWIAPANAPLRDVVGLEPALADGELLPLEQAHFNIVRRLPGGFTVLGADTLSSEPDWRQVGVRRLLMLLRRTALRRGMTYVFEPNGPVLRRAVERDLSQMLDELQRRGAFAGVQAAQSYRLAVHSDAARHEAGQLVVELAVAPAQPMRFLTLRFVQRGGRLTFLEDA